MSAKLARRVSGWSWMLAGFALLVFGAKLILIKHVGNATPYWDQWDGEADRLYRPWLEGTLTWAQLFSTHNEHRIFITRVFNLGLLALNGDLWDPILQMRVNACLHIAVWILLLCWLGKGLKTWARIVMAVGATAIMVLPFGWENTLAGFQSQFYFLLLFSLVFLRAMATARPFGGAWWGGLASGVLSFLSLASGALTLLAGFCMLGLRWWTSWRAAPARRQSYAGLAAGAVVLALAVAAVVLTPTIPGHAPLKAHGLGQFLLALAHIMSWPVRGNAAWLLVQLPLAVFMVGWLWGRFRQVPNSAFLMALGIWMLGQFASIAYGRAMGADASRYLDIFALGLILNLACLLAMLPEAGGRRRAWVVRLGGVWALTVVVGFAFAVSHWKTALLEKAAIGAASERNVRAYLETGDFSHLTGKPFFDVPYPDVNRLKFLLDNPTIAAILPGNIQARNAGRQPSWLEQAFDFLSDMRRYLLVVGGLLLLAGAWRASRCKTR